MSSSNKDRALLRKLTIIVEGREKFDSITVGQGLYPPCFESKRQFDAWLESADPELGSQPPARKDFPLEPNYCRDCNAKDRNKYRTTGRCLFPDTRFVTIGEGEDQEVIGTDR